jgi:hypothetical protein
MKNLIFVILLLILTLNSFGQNYLNCDYESRFNWGNPEGHVMCDLYMDSRECTFRFIIRDDLFFDEIIGTYEIQNGNYIFHKNKVIELGVINKPIVIESFDSSLPLDSIYFNVSSTESSILYGYTLSQRVSGTRNVVVLEKEDWKFEYALQKPNTNQINFIIPFNFSELLGKTLTVNGDIIEADSAIIINGFKFIKSPCITPIVKRKLFKGKK